MDFFRSASFNYLSTGSIIATGFCFFVFLFFLLIKNKAKPSHHLMFLYLMMTLHNAGYLIALTFYHPWAAYHRWLTVFVSFAALIHMTQFFMYFTEKPFRGTAGVLQTVQWIFTVCVTAYFIILTKDAPKAYSFTGHHWDFATGGASSFVAWSLLAFILIAMTAGVVNIASSKKGRRASPIIMLATFFLTAGIPGIANALNRSGAIDRGAFQITWNIVSMLGVYLTFAAYINVTDDRTKIMTKILAISMVSYLMIFQIFSYFSLQDAEKAYDDLHAERAANAAFDAGHRPPDLEYLAFLSFDGMRHGIVFAGGTPVPVPDVYPGLLNALFFQKLISDGGRFAGDVRAGAEAMKWDTAFMDASAAFLDSLPPDKKNDRRVTGAFAEYLARSLREADRGIQALPSEGFRKAFGAWRARAGLPDVLAASLAARAGASRLEDGALREELVRYLSPVKSPSVRYYRGMESRGNCTSFMYVDTAHAAAYEAGFSYRSYRDFLHPSAKTTAGVIFGGMVAILGFFFFLYMRELAVPLGDLLKGVEQMKSGNLNVAVPVRRRDEIGYLAAMFNISMAYLRDVTQETARMRSFLKNIIDSMPSVLFSVGTDLRITQWNQAAETSTGLSEKDARGRLFHEAFPPLESRGDEIRSAIAARQPLKMPKLPYQRGDALEYFDIMIYPLAGDSEGAVIRIDNVTERARFEEMMVQTEKMMSVGGLAAGMAHEINNPLGGILLAVQNITRRLSPDFEKNLETAGRIGIAMQRMQDYLADRNILKMLEDIRDMGERASKIVANMLSFSRRSHSHMETANLRDLLERTVELAANDYDLKKKYDFRQIEILREFDEGMPNVDCVSIELQQVVLNLLKNAAQAINEKKDDGAKPRITIRTIHRNGTAVIEVEDNGPGMDEETRKRVFEPFYTTKKTGSGTGLGLSVSFFIISNNHGGTITVESARGAGTKFIVQIPVRRKAS